ncbi:50S ribosomal protein L32e [Vulcanisaeta thermophila]|uniref:50S ribosomal protein L32e n=1 Tax=Vulcanisaeta thermophila TaxID=867917 RepID=UPI000A063600|nr:50S ribosomal protein L32e [Vulcanisaeta thermophila]
MSTETQEAAQAQQEGQQQQQQQTQEAKATEKRELKLPNPRITLTGRLRQLMRLRLRMERRMPRWMRMDEWRYLRVAHGEHWRRPRGNDNKIRLEIKGYPKRVKVGYGKPKAVRGLHPSGFKTTIVHRPEDLDRVDPTREAIIIARTVGLRKRIEIIRKAMEKGIKIINPTKEAIEKLSTQ